MSASAAPVFFTFAANNETPSNPQVNQLMFGCDKSFGGDCRHLPMTSIPPLTSILVSCSIPSGGSPARFFALQVVQLIFSRLQWFSALPLF